MVRLGTRILLAPVLLGCTISNYSSPFYVHLVQAEELSSCDCSCCTVEKRDEVPAEQILDGNLNTVEIECDVRVVVPEDLAHLHFLAKSQLQACQAKRCLQPAADMILEGASSDGELDQERFCRAECAPTAAHKGADCSRKPNRPDSAGERAFVHFAKVVAPVVVGAIPNNADMSLVEAGRRELGTSAAHQSRAGNEYKSEFTKALEKLLVKGKAVAQDGEQLAKEASAAAKTAKDGAVFAKAAVKKNTNAAETKLPEIALEAEESQLGSSNILQKLSELEQNVESAASEAAEDQVADTVKGVEETALAATKDAALKEAEKRKEEMVAKAPAAGAEAEKPYVEAQQRAADRAAEYQKRGDEFAQLSNQWQMESSLAVNNANQLELLGKKYEADRAMAKARFLMDQASGLTNTAQNLYNTAEQITESLPAYGAQASAANYHAQFLLNPDVPAPRPPIV